MVFIDFIVSVADSIYSFLVSFSAQIVNGLNITELAVVTPLNFFWFCFTVNIVLLPFLFLAPRLHFGRSKSKSNKKDN